MTEFVIKLADERGRVMEQSHAAATAEELKARFTQAGYFVYSVKAKSALGASKKKVKLETFLVFNQQFLTLIKAGLPILGSLELLGKRQKIPHFRAQLEDVASRVKTGESISQAFEAQGGFPIVYTTTLLAGERSGNLEEVLQRFLEFQRVSLTFRKKLKASLIYPALLVVMVIALFIFLITFVVPRWVFAVPLVKDGCGRESDRQDSDQAAGVWECVAEVPGGAVFADTVYATDGRVAAGAIA
jgi:type IV pilus assembly protein PilC